MLAVPMLSAARPAGPRGARRAPAPDGRGARAPASLAGSGRALVRPRPRGLDLRGDLQQRVLAERLADDLHGRRQVVLAEADRDRDRRLARDVEQRRERRERARSGRGRAIGCSPTPLQSPIASGRSASAGVSSRSYSAKNATIAARQRLQLGDRAEVADRASSAGPARGSRATAARSRRRPAGARRAARRRRCRARRRARRRATNSASASLPGMQRARPPRPRGRARRAARAAWCMPRTHSGSTSTSSGLAVVIAIRSRPGRGARRSSRARRGARAQVASPTS